MDELPDLESTAALSAVALADGWMDPAQLHCLINKEAMPYSKANTCMASEGTVQDLYTKLS